MLGKDIFDRYKRFGTKSIIFKFKITYIKKDTKWLLIQNSTQNHLVDGQKSNIRNFYKVIFWKTAGLKLYGKDWKKI